MRMHVSALRRKLASPRRPVSGSKYYRHKPNARLGRGNYAINKFRARASRRARRRLDFFLDSARTCAHCFRSLRTALAV